MKHAFLALAAMLFAGHSFAQHTLSGKVTDANTADILPGTTITLQPGNLVQSTTSEGTFSFSNLQTGTYTLQASFIGFAEQKREVTLVADQTIEIALQPSAKLADEVVVSAIRATDKTPTTFSTVSKEEIEERNFGQDLPYLLDLTPSTVVTSDAGAGVGYTGIRIRGSDISRINVTVNGIPINDSESHGVFFVNMPDFASSVEDMQVQRGVGTSTNGAGAFGASINIKTETLRREAYAETDNSFGSFNTMRNNVRFGTGLLNGKFAFDGRLSRITSDGYIDRASSDLKSFYLSGGYHGEKTMVKFVTFSGTEKTYQAWYGTPEALVYGNSADLAAYINRNYITGADSANLVNSGRKYNYYTYDNQTDNYQQDHYQLHFSHDFAKNLNVGGALHYTRGRGYYEEYRPNDRYSNYNLPNLELTADTITRTDLIRRRWLDNHFYGATYAVNYQPTDKVQATLGGAWNRYTGAHFGEIIWARFASSSNIRDRYYDNDAVKTDFNTFAKVNFEPVDKVGLFADVQYRAVGYEFIGLNRTLESIEQSVNYKFWNPKGGITFSPSVNNTFYASYAVSNREPVRRDFTDSSPDSRPQHETLHNIEAGYRTRGKFGSEQNPLGYQLELNVFNMDYRNQLVLTGQINDVGAYTRTNIASSYRRGVELGGSVDITKFITLQSNVAYSQNKLKNFSDFVDDYDTGEQEVTTFTESDISFSPDWVTSSQLRVRPLKGLEAAFIYRTVSQQYLDNTSNENRVIPAYQVADVRLRYRLPLKETLKEIEFGLLVNNIFSEKYAASGYTYSYIAGEQLTTENFYYPQATRNYLGQVSLRF